MNRIKATKPSKAPVKGPQSNGSPAPDQNPSSAPPRQKQYLARLEGHQLPTEPASRLFTLPTQARLAQIAAAIPLGTGNDKTAYARVQKALQLWNAAGGLLHAQKQARVVAEGLLHFNLVHWRRHATSLLVAMDDSCFTEQLAGEKPLSKGQSNATVSHNLVQMATRAVEAFWRRRSLTNADVLKGIFFGRNDQNIYTQSQMLSDLLAYAKATLGIASTAQLSDAEIQQGRQNPDLFNEHKSELDVWHSSIEDAWRPLGLIPERAAWELATLARGKVSNVPHFAAESSLADSPCIARWLAVMRQRQVSESKKRPSR